MCCNASFCEFLKFLKLGADRMVSVVLVILETLAALDTVFKVSLQSALMLDNNVTYVIPVENMPRTEPLYDHRHHHTSVHHYARHGLCRSFDGQKNLYKAFKTKFCNTRLSFTAEFVIELCKRKDNSLDKWVAELFDLDGDGIITHHEKNFYKNVR